MITYPNIDPVAVALGPVKIHWYGLMYVFGIGGAWLFGRWRAKSGRFGLTPEHVDDVTFYLALGLVLGGRIGYVLFYNFSAFLSDPLMLFKVWQGGMSFHGALLGVITGSLLAARQYHLRPFTIFDFYAVLMPIGLFFGRIGNFINSELWGKTSDVAWAMVFPGAGPLPRHPSQLYEAALEGLVLFIILWIYSSKPRPPMAVSGVCFILYGVFRFGVEFVRLPDAHLGYLAFGWLTMGQILTIPMIIYGLYMVIYSYYRAGRSKQEEAV